MSSTRALFALTLAGLLAMPGTALARFGSHGGHGGHGGSSGSSSSSHKAVPVGAHPTANPGPFSQSHWNPVYHGRGYNLSGDRRGGAYYGSGYYYSREYGYLPFYGAGYAPYYSYGPGYGYYGPAAAPVAAPAAGASSAVSTIVGVGGGLQTQGSGSIGIGLAFEGRRWGVNTEFMSIFSPSQVAAGQHDLISLFDAHLTYAFFSTPRGRVRIEAGFDSIFPRPAVSAPGDVVGVLAPDVGASTSWALLGPLGVEAAARASVYPHGQLDPMRIDLSAGPALTLGALVVRAGWRYIRLDDAGLLADGTRNIDVFSGPYCGFALAI